MSAILNYTVQNTTPTKEPILYAVKQKRDKTYELDSTNLMQNPGTWQVCANLTSMMLTTEQNNLTTSMTSKGKFIYIADRYNLLLHIFNSATLKLEEDKHLPSSVWKNPNDFTQNQTFYVAPNGDLYIAGGKNLFVSKNNGISWQLIYEFATQPIKVASDGNIMIVSTQGEAHYFYVASLGSKTFRKQSLGEFGYVNPAQNIINAVLFDPSIGSVLLTFYQDNVILSLSYLIDSSNNISFKKKFMRSSKLSTNAPVGSNIIDSSIFAGITTISIVTNISSTGMTQTLADEISTTNEEHLIATGIIPTEAIIGSYSYQSLPKLQTYPPVSAVYLDQFGALYLGQNNMANWTSMAIINN